MHDNAAPSRPHHQRHFEIAAGQGGYFTARQARAGGFSSALLSYHAGRGRFIRVRRGLYRLRDFPASSREDVVAAWLAVGRDAVVSHESALDLLGISDVVPTTVHLIVPRSQRYAPSLPGITVHTTSRPLGGDEVLTREGVPLTSATRAILDAAESGTAPEQIVVAVRSAVASGLATPSRLVKAARQRGRHIQRLVRLALESEAGT